MTSTKYIGMDVHKESISIAVRNGAGKIAMEGVIETKASMILQFINGLRGDLHECFHLDFCLYGTNQDLRYLPRHGDGPEHRGLT